MLQYERVQSAHLQICPLDVLGLPAFETPLYQPFILFQDNI